MNKLTIVQYGNELVATLVCDDDFVFIKGDATEDFLYDCADLILKFEEKLKEKKGK